MSVRVRPLAMTSSTSMQQCEEIALVWLMAAPQPVLTQYVESFYHYSDAQMM